MATGSQVMIVSIYELAAQNSLSGESSLVRVR